MDSRRRSAISPHGVCSRRHRHLGLRLLRALLAQQGYHFTDLSRAGTSSRSTCDSASSALDTATALVPNLPWPYRTRGVRALISDPEEIARRLRARPGHLPRPCRGGCGTPPRRRSGDETLLRDLPARPAKGLPLFASFVYVGNPALFEDCRRSFIDTCLLRHRIPFTLNELRVVGSRPRWSHMLRSPRPKMYRSPTLRPDQIDYLYSELACVAW